MENGPRQQRDLKDGTVVQTSIDDEGNINPSCSGYVLKTCLVMNHMQAVSQMESCFQWKLFQTCVLLPDTEEIMKQSRISGNGKGVKSSREDSDWTLLESYLGSQDYNEI